MKSLLVLKGLDKICQEINSNRMDREVEKLKIQARQERMVPWPMLMAQLRAACLLCLILFSGFTKLLNK